MPGIKKLRMLSLDGGGAKGWAQIVLLKEVVYQVKLHSGDVVQGFSDEHLYPCDYFDLIVGSGTGGVNGIMIGRLGMSMKQIEGAWRNLGKILRVQPSKLSLPTPLFNMSNLEEWAKNLVQEHTGNPDSRMREEGRQNTNDRSCKNVAVTVMRASNIGLSTVFRTYHVRENPEANCCIWEAILATMNSPLLYEPISIGENGWTRATFTSAELGVNNPVSVMLGESQKIWGKRGHHPVPEPGCIVSIGTGKTLVPPISTPRSGFISNVMKYIWTQTDDPLVTREMQLYEASLAVTKDCEEKHQDIKRSFSWDAERGGIYFRLNVEHGMQAMDENAYDESARYVMNTHATSHIGHADFESDYQKVAEKLWVLSQEYQR